MIWLDAICINQSNLVERQSQIAGMGEIYSQCWRVVIWLGYDMVTHTPKGPRRRYPLEEIQSNIPEVGYLEKLIYRRYFRRVWIIQELVMAPSSFLPLQDMEFMIRALTPKSFLKILNPSTWDSLQRPWLQHLHSMSEFPADDFFEVFKHTWSSNMQATDPRDKIFGIFGLVNQWPRQFSHRLVPDYLLSYHSVIIVISAYILLNLNRYEVLAAAKGLGAQPPYPSWIPGWNENWFRREEYGQGEDFTFTANHLSLLQLSCSYSDYVILFSPTMISHHIPSVKFYNIVM